MRLKHFVLGKEENTDCSQKWNMLYSEMKYLFDVFRDIMIADYLISRLAD